MSGSISLIPAEIGSGNLAIKAKFDAARWFEQARREEIGALAACGWKGWGAEASLVAFFLPLEEEVQIVVDYARRTRTDVVFSIDAHAAMAWIRKHRTGLIAEAQMPLSRRDPAVTHRVLSASAR